MGADVDYDHPEVRQDTLDWGKWVIEETGAAGFSFDAVKVSFSIPAFLSS